MAPRAARVRAESIAPSRAANISAVHPPRGNGEFGPPLRGNSSTGASITVLAEPLLARVDVSALADEQLQSRRVAGARRGHDHRLAPGAQRIGARPRLEERAQRLDAAVGRRQRDRGDAVAIGRGRVPVVQTKGMGDGTHQFIFCIKPFHIQHRITFGKTKFLGLLQSAFIAFLLFEYFCENVIRGTVENSFNALDQIIIVILLKVPENRNASAYRAFI